jgi:hypothetical protein
MKSQFILNQWLHIPYLSLLPDELFIYELFNQLELNEFILFSQTNHHNKNYVTMILYGKNYIFVIINMSICMIILKHIMTILNYVMNYL